MACSPAGGEVGLQVTLTIEGSGEGRVVKGSGSGVAAGVGRHSLDTVLSLVWWQLATQDVRCDVWLKTQVQYAYNTGHKQYDGHVTSSYIR